MLRCSASSGRREIASRSSTSDQILGFSLPRYVSERKSERMPLPERWRRKPGVWRVSRPEMIALRDGSWSEFPLSRAEA